MTRRSSFGPAGFPIRRGFEPSRSQLRTLAFAFEQALPLVRKNVNQFHKITNDRILRFIDPKTRSVASGARS